MASTLNRFRPIGDSATGVESLTHGSVGVEDFLVTAVDDGAQPRLQLRRKSDLEMECEVTELIDRDGGNHGAMKTLSAICLDNRFLWVADAKPSDDSRRISRLSWGGFVYDKEFNPALPAGTEFCEGLAVDRVRLYRINRAAKFVGSGRKGWPFSDVHVYDIIDRKPNAIAVTRDEVLMLEYNDDFSVCYVVRRPRDGFTPVIEVGALPTLYNGMDIAVDDTYIYVVGYDVGNMLGALLIYHRARLLVNDVLEAYKTLDLKWTVENPNDLVMTVPQGVGVDGDYIYIAGQGIFAGGAPCGILVKIHAHDDADHKVGDYVDHVVTNTGSASTVACLSPIYFSELINEPQLIEGTISMGIGAKSLTRKAWRPPDGLLSMGMALTGVINTFFRVTGLVKFGVAITGRIGQLLRQAGVIKLGLKLTGQMRALHWLQGTVKLGLRLTGVIFTRSTGIPWAVLLVDDTSIGQAAVYVDDLSEVGYPSVAFPVVTAPRVFATLWESYADTIPTSAPAVTEIETLDMDLVYGGLVARPHYRVRNIVVSISPLGVCDKALTITVTFSGIGVADKTYMAHVAADATSSGSVAVNVVHALANYRYATVRATADSEPETPPTGVAIRMSTQFEPNV